jgi:hypothetical protein
MMKEERDRDPSRAYEIEKQAIYTWSLQGLCYVKISNLTLLSNRLNKNSVEGTKMHNY